MDEVYIYSIYYNSFVGAVTEYYQQNLFAVVKTGKC